MKINLNKMKIKKTAFRMLSFLGNNILSILVVTGLGFYIFSDEGMEISSPYEGVYRKEAGGVASVFDKDMVMTESVQSSSPRMMSKRMPSFKPVPPVFAEQGLAPEATSRKIVKNAQLSIEVADSEVAKSLAEEEIKALGGFVTNMNSYEVRTGTLAYNLTARVPAEKLDIALTNLTTLGDKKSESFSSNDITAQYTDTEAQIKNLETRRTRLRKMLEFKTENLSDVLQVDRELSTVQQQIEQLTRTQKGRDEQVIFSTLTLRINPKIEIGDITNPEWNPEKSWKTSVNDLIKQAQKIFDKLVTLFVFTPLWLPVLIILWLVKRRIWKK